MFVLSLMRSDKLKAAPSLFVLPFQGTEGRPLYKGFQSEILVMVQNV
jgi:hypothetical protein